MPTSSGSYYAKSVTANDNSDYWGGDNKTPVQVTVSGGKITADISAMTMLKVPLLTDSAKLTLHLTEQ